MSVPESVPDMFIPPEGINFRLLGCVSQKYLYSRPSNDPTFFHYEEGPFDDQWWHLLHGKGDRAGYYAIQSKYTGKVIFSRTSADPRVGHVDGDGMYKDNWFKLEPGTGKNDGRFRLRNDASNTVLFSRSIESMARSGIAIIGEDYLTLGNHPADAKPFDDQYFSFMFEDMKISKIEYKHDEARILAQKPEIIGVETQINDSEVPQTMEFSFSQTRATSYTFSHKFGHSITIGASGKVGIPLIAEGEVKLETTQTYEFSWGQQTTDSTVIGTKFNVTAPRNSRLTASAKVTRADVDVPFTVYFKSAATGYEVAIDGIYKGVSYWNTVCEYKQDALH